jgi:hypothetical protein
LKKDLAGIAQRIEQELPDLHCLQQRAVLALQRAVRLEDDLYWDSVALNLHGLYDGLERLFELIALRVDSNLPAGADRHKQLLLRMASDLPGIRPAVISQPTWQGLDDLRGFRHVVRHVYTMNLDPIKLKGLAERSQELLARLDRELTAFSQFLLRF